jgi:hypothetical protein
MPLLRRGACWLLDALLLALALASVAILVTGGGVFLLAGHEVSALRARNPLLALLGLLPIRFRLGRDVPLLAVLPLERVRGACARACRALHEAVGGLTPARAARVVLALMAGSALVKLANAWHYDGFSHGDAIEIHRMTLSALQGRDLAVWDVRSAFYPMSFVFPAQWLLHSLGISDPWPLVFAGRVIVIGFSLLNIWLTYRVGQRWFGRPAPGVLAAALLAVCRLHVKLGSTELPRTVASAFRLCCFLLLAGRSAGIGRALLAGGALGLGAALRFGEAVFALPFAVQLAMERRYAALVAGLAAAGAAAALVLGPGDLLYWPEPFHSLRHMLDFAVVRRLSSSGYEPFWEYLRTAPQILDPFLLALVVLGVLASWPGAPALWTALPVVALSFFQRKDERYLLPVLPFAMLCAAPIVERLLAWARARSWSWRPALVVWVLAGATLLEIDGCRRRGSEDAVAVARFLAARRGVRDVAMEDGTTVTGADIYLAGRAKVFNIDAQRMGEAAYFHSVLRRLEAQYVVVRERTLRGGGYEALLRGMGFVPVRAEACGFGEWRIFQRHWRRLSGP